jgi:GNAT superfamily N-acetyltransferase
MRTHNPGIFALTADRWDDFERLFGPRGACGGCWCVFWKLSRKEFEAGKGEANRFRQWEIVMSNRIPGLLAYVDDLPVGWIAIEPRSEYSSLMRSHILAPLDDLPVWSVPCFYVDKRYRHQGLTVALLKAATTHVAKQGGKVVEGYPVEPKTGTLPAAFMYTGAVSAFRQARFVEAGRRSETRPIMRYYVK